MWWWCGGGVVVALVVGGGASSAVWVGRAFVRAGSGWLTPHPSPQDHPHLYLRRRGSRHPPGAGRVVVAVCPDMHMIHMQHMQRMQHVFEVAPRHSAPQSCRGPSNGPSRGSSVRWRVCGNTSMSWPQGLNVTWLRRLQYYNAMSHVTHATAHWE